jgi:hypothetical protein
MDEFIKSIKAFLYDRTVSPLFGAYLSAWSVWNYKVFIVLLDGKAELSTKLDFLDKYFGPQIHIVGNTLYISGWFYSGVFWPTLLTIFYLFGYPKLAKPVFETSLQNQIDLRKAKQEKEKQRLLSVEESIKLTAEIEQMRLKSDKDAENARMTTSRLTERINSLEAELNEKKSAESSTSNVSDTNLPTGAPATASSQEDLRSLVRSAVEAIPDGDFQFSDLFDNEEWKKLSESTRKEYGKQFKKLVDQGAFVSVSVHGKGASNQLIYRKRIDESSNDLTEFENGLTNRLKEDVFVSNAFDSNKQRVDLLRKIATYCVQSQISEDMLYILLDIVMASGVLDKEALNRKFSDRLSNIEIDHLLKKLQNQQLILADNYGKVYLSDDGKGMAFDSGLTSLVKKLDQQQWSASLRE